jgi:hypothetical protein
MQSHFVLADHSMEKNDRTKAQTETRHPLPELPTAATRWEEIVREKHDIRFSYLYYIYTVFNQAYPYRPSKSLLPFITPLPKQEVNLPNPSGNSHVTGVSLTL